MGLSLSLALSGLNRSEINKRQSVQAPTTRSYVFSQCNPQIGQKLQKRASVRRAVHAPFRCSEHRIVVIVKLSMHSIRSCMFHLHWTAVTFPFALQTLTNKNRRRLTLALWAPQYKMELKREEVVNRVMLQHEAEVKRARLSSAIRSSRNPANEVISVNPA